MQGDLTMKEKIVIIPVLLLGILTLAAVFLRLIYEDAAWLDTMAWTAVFIAVLNPGVLLILIPASNALGRVAGGYMVREAVTAEGVGRETLDRSAAIVEGESAHPIAVCLRAFCGDVAAPPDKYAEMPGLGVSAQFSGQMIHAGSAEYMRGLNVEAPDVPGKTVFIALEGRLLGYYRLLGPKETDWLRTRLKYTVITCAALKIMVWAVAALIGPGALPAYIFLEAASLLAVYANLRRLFNL
jgi:hypothetical protein